MINFVNPYNFIPLGKEKTVAEEEQGTLTGVISYSVYTKTPLFIPNTSNENTFPQKPVEGETAENEHKSYDFFSYTDLSDTSKTYEKDYFLPVIPGSEIRGLIRSNYEILTNSCLSAIDDEAILSKRTAETFQAGLIKKNPNGSYDLYQAKDYLWRTKGENSDEDELAWKDSYYTRKCYRQKDFPEGCKVYFEGKERGAKVKPLARNVSREDTKKGLVGYILKGEDGPKMNAKGEKHCCHIFVLIPNKIEERNMKSTGLDIALKEYEKNEEHLYKEYKENWNTFKQAEAGEYFPVYYSKVGKKVMLSPACITREIYQNKLKNIVGSFRACKDRQNLCPACSLFGTIENELQVSSRIRFSDLTCEKGREAKDYYDEIVTLLPLSSPKLNNMEFYLQKPEDAWFWTYDYYVDSKGNVIEHTSQINGRKFYWHQMNMTLQKGVQQTKLNMTIRPVKRNVIFSGKLYFQKLTKTELNTLLWLLNAGDEGSLEEKQHGYKLGAAKPLGLGSIAIGVDEVCLKKLVRDDEAKTIRREEDKTFSCFGSEEGFLPEILQNFRKMTDFEAVKGKLVCYPTTKQERKAEEELNGYEWFVENHRGYIRRKKKETNMPNTRNDMYFREHMKAMEPELQETRSPQSLETLERTGGQFQNRKPVGKPKGNRPPEKKCTGVIKKITAKEIVIEVEGKEGYIPKNTIPPFKAVQLKPGDSLQVSLEKEEKMKNGKSSYRYKLL